MFVKLYMILSLCFVCLVVSGCTDEDGSRRALKAMGFKSINLKGYAFFGCSEDDEFHTRFSAVNVNNEYVTGVVCCGFMKNCTVRTD